MGKNQLSDHLTRL